MSDPVAFCFGTEEQPFIDAIKAAPDDLTAHLVYADWLDDHQFPDRAAALRDWVALVRLPVTIERMDAHYNAYRYALVEEEAPWIEAVEGVRQWVPKPFAERVIRLFIDEMYGPVAATEWSVDVRRCIFDNRWSGEYKGTLLDNDGKPVEYEGTLFVDQIFASKSGHVTKLG